MKGPIWNNNVNLPMDAYPILICLRSLVEDLATANFKYNLHNPSDYFDNIKLEKIMTTKYFCFGILKIYAHPCAKTTQH